MSPTPTGDFPVTSEGDGGPQIIEPPPPPSGLALAAESDSGAAGDGVTNDATPTITGNGDPGDTITLYDGDTVVGTGNGGSSWSVTASMLADGTHSLTATQTFASEFSSSRSAALVLTIDTTPPAAPSGLALAASSDSGTVGDGVTDQRTPTITGTGEAGDTVTLYDGSTGTGSTTVAGDGSWSITTSTLADGPHSLTAKQTDIAGNVGPASSALSVTIDTVTAPLVFALANFGAAAGGWTSETTYPRRLGDVNGDGMDDIVGFGANGVYVALATGSGNFAAPVLASGGFGTDSGGWSSDNSYPRELADVNGDGRADIVGFGANGVYVALANSDGTFGNTFLAAAGFGTDSGGWSGQDKYPRELADVNGDGRADIVGFGANGVYVALANSDGTFGNAILATTGFGAGSGWSSNDTYPRQLADVNGDGKADIVGFGSDGVYVAFGKADGTFGDAFLAATTFGADSGWTSNDTYPRDLADINHDGRADIVAFASDGVYAALGNSDGTFQPPVFDFNSLGANAAAGGWTTQNTYPRLVGDVTGDGRSDIVAFASDGVYIGDAAILFAGHDR